MDEQLKKIETLLEKYKKGKLSVEEQEMLDRLLDDILKRMESSAIDIRLFELIEEYRFHQEFMAEVGLITHFDPSKVDAHTKQAWQDFARSVDIPTIPLEIPSAIPPRRRGYVHYGIGIAAAVLLLIGIGLPHLRPIRPISQEVVSSIESPITNTFSSGSSLKSIHLSDGTVVHLNKETTLALRQGRFNAHTREVWLQEGEAFFEVAKDAKRPFIVHMPDGLSTKVLGTSFNIKAYSAITKQVVSVKTGRVQVESEEGERILLTKDTKASFDPTSRTLTSAATDGEADAEWRSGRITFASAGREEVAMRIRQFYGVEMRVQNDALPHDMSLDSYFAAQKPLKEFAQRIAKIYKAQFKISENAITFY